MKKSYWIITASNLLALCFLLLNQTPLSEVFFVYLFSLLIFSLFIYLRLFINSLVVGVITLLIGGVATLSTLFIFSIVGFALFNHPAGDIRYAHLENLLALWFPLACICFSYVPILMKPIMSNQSGSQIVLMIFFARRYRPCLGSD